MILQKFKNNKGQVFASEYLIVLALAAAGILAMSVYFRRAVQARIRDARASMIDVVRERTAGTEAGLTVLPEYEPYYVDRSTNSTTNSAKTVALYESLSSNFTSGISQVLYNDQVNRETISNTAHPGLGD